MFKILFSKYFSFHRVTELKEVCTAMNISTFKDFEIKYLHEFVECMKPIADALDHLQGDKNCYMGDLIPTLLRTKDRVNMFSNKQLTYCTPLCQSLVKSLHNRFGDYLTLDDRVAEYILASVPHPFFKLRWVPESALAKVRQMFLDRAKLEAAGSCDETVVSSETQDQTNDFFHLTLTHSH